MMESGGVLKEDDVADKFIMNGQLGIVREVIENEGLVIQYDEDLIYVNKGKLNHLLLGYCLSCHKSQGSTMPYVINIISDSHQRMLNRNLEYVAITRACNKTICIGSYGAFSDCLVVEANDERNTLLRELILE
jgi:exodeoxyribonuclease V alpha subunit